MTGSGAGGAPVTWRDGRTITTSPLHCTKFEYEVDGRTFHRELSSSDSMQLRGWDFSPPGNPGPRAYYHPGRPEIAVLNPVPYRSTFLEIAIAASGLLAGLHLFFTLRNAA